MWLCARQTVDKLLTFLILMLKVSNLGQDPHSIKVLKGMVLGQFIRNNNNKKIILNNNKYNNKNQDKDKDKGKDKENFKKKIWDKMGILILKGICIQKIIWNKEMFIEIQLNPKIV